MKKLALIALAAMIALSIMPLVSARETQYSWGKDRDQYGCMASKGETYCERLSKCIDTRSQTCEGLIGRGSRWYLGTKTIQSANLRVSQKAGLAQTEGKNYNQAAQSASGAKRTIGTTTLKSSTTTTIDGSRITSTPDLWGRIAYSTERKDKPVYATTGRRAGNLGNLANLFTR
ncbi:MAG: hypothetical protein AABX47_08035 [Nanoarchaeota archaeon]|mgnify:CR=1 FL=1